MNTALALTLVAIIGLDVFPAILAHSSALRREPGDFDGTRPERVDVLGIVVISACFGLGLIGSLWYWTRVQPQLPARHSPGAVAFSRSPGA
ncbi:MAG: hypothetical protein AB7V43_07125 [Acidimicrobiia bacterium]